MQFGEHIGVCDCTNKCGLLQMAREAVDGELLKRCWRSWRSAEEVCKDL